MDNLCGNCKHWHEFPEQKYRCKLGVCDKIPFGTEFTVVGYTHKYNGWSFNDECYDDVFGCFEVKYGTERTSD